MTSLARLVHVLFLVSSTFSAFARITVAQVSSVAPIRVESDQVLVPVWVRDRKLYAQLDRMDHNGSYKDLLGQNFNRLEGLAVRDLVAKDFHLFEDSKEQTIQGISLESSLLSNVEDNFSQHPELIGSGGGRWEFPDRPVPDPRLWVPSPYYLIVYSPPPSAKGSCHQIEVSVGVEWLTPESRRREDRRGENIRGVLECGVLQERRESSHPHRTGNQDGQAPERLVSAGGPGCGLNGEKHSLAGR